MNQQNENSSRTTDLCALLQHYNRQSQLSLPCVFYQVRWCALSFASVPISKTALLVQLTIHGPSPETGLGTASGLPTHPCRTPYVHSGFTIHGPSPETGLGTASGYTTGRPSFDSTPSTILAKRVMIFSHSLNGWAQPTGGNICP